MEFTLMLPAGVTPGELAIRQMGKWLNGQEVNQVKWQSE
jgi:hypothetical protein